MYRLSIKDDSCGNKYKDTVSVYDRDYAEETPKKTAPFFRTRLLAAGNAVLIVGSSSSPTGRRQRPWQPIAEQVVANVLLALHDYLVRPDMRT